MARLMLCLLYLNKAKGSVKREEIDCPKPLSDMKGSQSLKPSVCSTGDK